jgi:NADH-quinone oxidoreductase subunit L
MINGVIRERYNSLSFLLSPTLLFISASLSTYLFFSSSKLPVLIDIEWFHVASVSFSATFELNPLSQVMMFMITLISFLIHVYSVGYMAGDQNIRRYFGMLGFFTFSMLGIVLSNNLILIFVFWELVGFSSYMLIGHWIGKTAAGRAAQKAFLFNRIGDAGFLIGIMIVWSNTQNMDLTNLLHLPEVYSWQTAATLCIF